MKQRRRKSWSPLPGLKGKSKYDETEVACRAWRATCFFSKTCYTIKIRVKKVGGFEFGISGGTLLGHVNTPDSHNRFYDKPNQNTLIHGRLCETMKLIWINEVRGKSG